MRLFYGLSKNDKHRLSCCISAGKKLKEDIELNSSFSDGENIIVSEVMKDLKIKTQRGDMYLESVIQTPSDVDVLFGALRCDGLDASQTDFIV